MNPEFLKQGAVWSWAENEPNSSNGDCVLINGTNDGRWQMQNCDLSLSIAC